MEAISRCCNHSFSAARKALAKEFMDLSIVLDAYVNNYRKALPEPYDYESTCDFIACVVYGMAIRAIDNVEGPKLLYGAQIALGAFRPSTRKEKHPA